MSCLNEERFVELLDGGGLDAASPDEGVHLRDCPACRESWATVAAAGAVLADARPRGAGSFVGLIPLVAASAVLLTIMAIIAIRHSPLSAPTPIKDPLTQFLEGSPEEVKSAREAILKSGRKALPGLLAARPKLRGSNRLQALEDLIWAIKRAGVQDPPDQAVLTTLETMKIDLQMEKATVGDTLAFMRDFCKLNLVLDPSLDASTVDVLRLKDTSLRSALEVLCAATDLDFDLRYGVVFLSSPLRLWSTDPRIGLPAANHWSNPAPQASDEGPTIQKLRTIRMSVNIMNAPLSAIADYMREIAGVTIRPEATIAKRLLTINVRDVKLEHVLELVTLPFGLDARLEGGQVVIFDPRR